MQKVVLPEIAAGAEGIETEERLKEVFADDPHVLFAVTESVPLEFGTTVMELVLELPVQPTGMVQV